MPALHDPAPVACLSHRCTGCGCVKSLPCPTVADIPAAQEELGRLGWVEDRKHRSFCSRECGQTFLAAEAAQQASADQPPKPLPAPKRPAQAEMFAATARAEP